jgi:hypothetical protein
VFVFWPAYPEKVEGDYPFVDPLFHAAVDVDVVRFEQSKIEPPHVHGENDKVCLPGFRVACPPSGNPRVVTQKNAEAGVYKLQLRRTPPGLIPSRRMPRRLVRLVPWNSSSGMAVVPLHGIIVDIAEDYTLLPMNNPTED